MYGVKRKVGPLCICCVVVWLVLVYGENWGQLAQSATAPFFSLPAWRGTGSFSWICPAFNSSISRRSRNLFLCPCKWAVRILQRWLNRGTWTTNLKKNSTPPGREGEEGGCYALRQLSPIFTVDQNQPYHYTANA